MPSLFDDATKSKKDKRPDKYGNIVESMVTGKIITLCGSTDFKYEYIRINKMLTLAGNVVLSCGVFKEDCSDMESYRDLLEAVHRKKIDMCEIVFVINCGGYIGSHTADEIKYAEKHKKTLMYLYVDGKKRM